MKIIGLLEEHDSDSFCTRTLNERLSGSTSIVSVKEKQMLINYLNRGVPVMKLLSFLIDVDGEHIGPHVLYTDGIWLWPGYYSFYIQKYAQLSVSEEFIKHVEKKQFEDIEISVSEKKYIEYILMKVFKAAFLKKFVIPEELQKIIDIQGEQIECY